jgi:hypothetical protein
MPKQIGRARASVLYLSHDMTDSAIKILRLPSRKIKRVGFTVPDEALLASRRALDKIREEEIYYG